MRIATILGSFALIAVPLVALQLAGVSSTTVQALSVMYAVLLGGTHFVITLAIYLHGDNLAYFASSPSNIAIYFVAPVAILVLFFFIYFFGLNAVGAGASAGFLFYVFIFALVVRALDFLHVVRQSFGMLQLFKGQTGIAFPTWMRRADNNFFLGMAALQLWTFFNGMRTDRFVFVLGPVSAILLLFAAFSFLAVMAGFATALGKTDTATGLWVPVSYFLFQSASASLAAWRSEFYTASLAMHYVEYHLIIFPRLFAFELNPTSRADRVAAWIRTHKVMFYAVVAVLAVFVSRDLLWPEVSARLGSRRELWLLFNLLSGIFVTHYFIEAFIWKFRNPYYRKSLAPLYFPQQNKGATAST